MCVFLYDTVSVPCVFGRHHFFGFLVVPSPVTQKSFFFFVGWPKPKTINHKPSILNPDTTPLGRRYSIFILFTGWSGESWVELEKLGGPSQWSQNWKSWKISGWKTLIINEIIKLSQIFLTWLSRSVILTPVTLPWLSRSVILPKTNQKRLICVCVEHESLFTKVRLDGGRKNHSEMVIHCVGVSFTHSGSDDVWLRFTFWTSITVHGTIIFCNKLFRGRYYPLSKMKIYCPLSRMSVWQYETLTVVDTGAHFTTSVCVCVCFLVRSSGGGIVGKFLKVLTETDHLKEEKMWS
jgi:hypothetical protein